MFFSIAVARSRTKHWMSWWGANSSQSRRRVPATSLVFEIDEVWLLLLCNAPSSWPEGCSHRIQCLPWAASLSHSLLFIAAAVILSLESVLLWMDVDIPSADTALLFKSQLIELNLALWTHRIQESNTLQILAATCLTWFQCGWLYCGRESVGTRRNQSIE